jgi:hypothetical protein
VDFCTHPAGSARPPARAFGQAMTDARTGGQAELLVVNDYRWVGEPSLGSFTVYLDGRRVGVAPLHGTLEVSVTPGAHLVRVRHWWFASKAIPVEAGTERLTLRTDVARSGSLTSRMLRAMFRPNALLTLEPDAGARSSGAAATGPQEAARATFFGAASVLAVLAPEAIVGLVLRYGTVAGDWGTAGTGLAWLTIFGLGAFLAMREVGQARNRTVATWGMLPILVMWLLLFSHTIVPHEPAWLSAGAFWGGIMATMLFALDSMRRRAGG